MFDIICSCLYHSDLWIMKEACQRQLLDASIIRPSTWNINNGFHTMLDVACLSLPLSMQQFNLTYCCSLEKENPTKDSWFPRKFLLTEKDSSVGPSVFSISSKLLVSSSLVNGGTIGTGAKQRRITTMTSPKTKQPFRRVSQVHSFWLVKNGCALISTTPFLPSRVDLEDSVHSCVTQTAATLTDRWGKHRSKIALQWTKEFLRERRDFRDDSWFCDTFQPGIRRRMVFHLCRRSEWTRFRRLMQCLTQ